MKLFNRTNRAYSVLYINVPNTLQKSVVTSRLRIRQSVDIIIISNYRQRFLNCVAYCPGFLQNTLTVFCSLVWWVDFMSGLVVESFQPPSLLILEYFCVLNGLADHFRNISVFLSADLGFIKPDVMAGLINSTLAHSWLRYVPILDIRDVFLHPNTDASLCLTDVC